VGDEDSEGLGDDFWGVIEEKKERKKDKEKERQNVCSEASGLVARNGCEWLASARGCFSSCVQGRRLSSAAARDAGVSGEKVPTHETRGSFESERRRRIEFRCNFAASSRVTGSNTIHNLLRELLQLKSYTLSETKVRPNQDTRSALFSANTFSSSDKCRQRTATWSRHPCVCAPWPNCRRCLRMARW
jgi:hypothetical protein